MVRRWIVAVCAALLTVSVLSACATVKTNGSKPSTPDRATTISAAWGVTSAAPCDPIQPAACLLPFPDDYYTVPDKAMPTGRRIDLPASALPESDSGSRINPAPWNANDGFSPGSVILAVVPGLDLGRSAIATLSDIGPSLDADAPVVLLDATTGERWPYWAELAPGSAGTSEPVLMVHPARNLIEGDHYVVALRQLRASSGATIAPQSAFAEVLADTKQKSAHAQLDEEHLQQVLAILNAHDVPDTAMFLAWDFTVASEQDLAGPALTMRNQSFAALGQRAPTFRITDVQNDPAADIHVARVVTGTFEVPDYLSTPGITSGSVLNAGPSGMPEQLGHDDVSAPFECEIPKAADPDPQSAAGPVKPAHIGIYGHGLFGDDSEVMASGVPELSDAYDFSFCSTDWFGLSDVDGDPAFALKVVSDLNYFPSLVGHLMQSLLDAQFLGRLLDDPSGFASSSAFQDARHRPLINASSGLVYYGNSEGGIMGGAFIALSLDARRAVLGVPGMDYAVLLNRSSDFAPFLTPLETAYPDHATQQIGFDLLQMLWDRAEADGYAEQMTGSPLPGTPAHEVLLEEAFGDHQVANVTTETEARTIGALVHTPTLSPGRSNEAVPFWGISALPAQYSGDAALFVWDSGVPAAPIADVAPTSGPDPHDTVPRMVPAFWKQAAEFFSDRTDRRCLRQCALQGAVPLTKRPSGRSIVRLLRGCNVPGAGIRASIMCRWSSTDLRRALQKAAPQAKNRTCLLMIVIVDDHELLRTGTRQILSEAEGMEVVAEAADAAQAIEAVSATRPDIVLVDIRLPDRNGIELAKLIIEQSPSTRVVILSAYDDEDYVRAAMDAGVAGYLLKTMPGDELVRAVRAAASGVTVLDSAVTSNLGREHAGAGGDPKDAFSALTWRERQVVDLVAEGLANKAIATRLGISGRDGGGTSQPRVREARGRLAHRARPIGACRARQGGPTTNRIPRTLGRRRAVNAISPAGLGPEGDERSGGSSWQTRDALATDRPWRDWVFWLLQVGVIGIFAVRLGVEEAVTGNSVPGGPDFTTIALFIWPVLYAAVAFGATGGSFTTALVAALSVSRLVAFANSSNTSGVWSESTQLVILCAIALVVGRRVAAERVARLQADEARREHLAAEARYRGLFSTNSAPILIVDGSGAVVEANPAALTLFGRAQGRTIWNEALRPARSGRLKRLLELPGEPLNKTASSRWRARAQRVPTTLRVFKKAPAETAAHRRAERRRVTIPTTSQSKASWYASLSEGRRCSTGLTRRG